VSEPRVIRRLLVANRGEIALRIFATCRELGIGTVAVHSDPDAGAPFVRAADAAVAIGGRAPAESYLRAEAIVDAARRAGAQAVHPGYGFLAENAAFAQAVLDAGLVWVGPPPEVIAAMGSKIEAKRRMAQAGVPVLESEDVTGLQGDALARAAERVGYPLLAKASAGGGGKGMRVVREPGQLAEAVQGARREAASAFGDDALFLERYLEAPRHVEVQILGDARGEVVSLHERECSIQRRHQKVLEESPSPALDPELRARMEQAARAAGEELGYVGAGTVEFLLAGEGDSLFFFLEMNTRLQVEHPVTELVTGLDLVALQLAIAEGRPLPAPARQAPQRGHAVEVRLYAEDAQQGFLPATGRLARFRLPARSGLRVDTGVEDGSEIAVHYDPMLAKVIAHADTRAEALRLLADALRRAELMGATTNRDFLVRLVEHPEIQAGATDTGFLERHDPATLGAPLLDAGERRRHAAAAALALQAGRRAHAPVLGSLPSGWRNVPSQDQEVLFDGPAGAIPVRYRFDRGRLVRLEVDGEALSDPVLHHASAEAVQLEVAGLRESFGVHAEGRRVWVSSASGQLDLEVLPRHPDPLAREEPGSLRSPMPGSVVRVVAELGATVHRGEVVAVIEAMKMEHEIVAPATGTVAELHVSGGDQVDAGSVLAVIEEGERG
jgi:propionyl-CoA carboxylase alpha chain